VLIELVRGEYTIVFERPELFKLVKLLIGESLRGSRLFLADDLLGWRLTLLVGRALIASL